VFPVTGGDRRRQRLEDARLYLVTSGRLRAGTLDDVLPRVLEAGVDIVQLREKSMEARPLLALAEVVRRRTEEFGALFIVNDRVDVAIAAGADGVHVGQDDLPVAEARRQLGAGGLIGLSTHREEEVLTATGATGAAPESRPDYFAAGPVHATPTKPGRPAVGIDLVAFAAAHAVQPFFAIGGIDETTLPGVLAAGARRVAVVRALTEAGDPGEAARTLAELLRPR
jgi:thiamine-phosphate pyrophosphorylase